MPHLPLETIEHIVRLSLPPIHFDTSAERSALLRSYSLVSPTWRGLAQRELFACPVVGTKEQAVKLLETLRTRPDLGARVKALRIGGDKMESAEAMKIPELCGACLGVEELHMRKVRYLSPNSIRVLAGLRKMSLHTVAFDLDAQPSDFYFPFLQQLTLNRRHTQSIDPLLAPTALPSLRGLYYDGGAIAGRAMVLSLIQQLDTFTVTPLGSFTLRPFDWVPIRMLWAVNVEWDSIVGIPPAFLHHVRIRCDPTSPKDRELLNYIMAWLSGHPRHLQSLQCLFVPSPLAGVDTLDLLLEYCRERSIQVVFEDVHADESMISEHFSRRAREAKEKTRAGRES